MAENPVATIVRLLTGVVLMEGRLGHQVLGQMLVMNTNEVAVAGAAVAVAATSRQKDAVAQVAIRTALPALAVRALLYRTERQVERKLELLADREREHARRRRDNEALERDLERGARALSFERSRAAVAPPAAIPEPTAEAAENVARLERRNRSLQATITRLRAERRAAQAASPAPQVPRGRPTKAKKKKKP